MTIKTPYAEMTPIEVPTKFAPIIAAAIAAAKQYGSLGFATHSYRGIEPKGLWSVFGGEVPHNETLIAAIYLRDNDGYVGNFLSATQVICGHFPHGGARKLYAVIDAEGDYAGQVVERDPAIIV